MHADFHQERNIDANKHFASLGKNNLLRHMLRNRLELFKIAYVFHVSVSAVRMNEVSFVG